MDLKRIMIKNNIFTVEFEDEEMISIKISDLNDKHKDLIMILEEFAEIYTLKYHNRVEIDDIEKLLLCVLRDMIDKIIEL